MTNPMETIKKNENSFQSGQKILNPFFEIVQDEIELWAKGNNLYENESERIITNNQHLNKFASRLYPNASLTELQPISKFILVLFLADDRADKLDGSERVRFWKNILRDFDQGTSEKNQFYWEALLSDFPPDPWKQNIASLALAGKNIRNMVRNFIMAGIWEADNLLENKPPLPENYLKKLKYSSGAEIAIHYLTFIQSNKIDSATLYSPELKQLRKTLILLICLSNDLASFRKEESSGDFHNLVLLYEIHFKLNRKESIAKVTEKLNLLKKDYLSLQKQLLNNPGICIEKKKSICDSFNRLLLGCEIWAKEDTGRYN